MSENIIAYKKMVIASYMHVMGDEFTTLGGPALALRNYLKTRAAKLMCVWQPLQISDTLDGLAEIFENGARLVHRLRMPNIPWQREGGINWLYVVLKLRDMLADLYFALRFRDSYDYWIGVEALNALMGVFLRRLGFVKRVVYYNLDYGEIRFKNGTLNWIFHSLDRLAARHANAVWNLSPEMARTRAGLVKNKVKFAPQVTVPIGTEVERIPRLPIEQIDRNAIIYLGLLSENTGAMLTLEAMPAILKQKPDAKLLIVGSGPLEKGMRARAEQLGISSRVEFMGRVSDQMVERILCRGVIGVAPYAPDPDSIKKFTDVTKPRMYMTCGLPVVITDVPPIAKEIVENRAGVIVDYDPAQLAHAVLALVSDELRLREYRENAIRLASKYSWNEIFSRAFAETMNVVGA